MTAAVVLLAVGLVLALLGLLATWRRGVALSTRVRALERRAPVGEGDLEQLRGDLAQALRHVAVVRYDAFGDMGGRLSFSAALVDDSGDGLVMSSIHGRGESRTYAKAVVGGDADATLTPEEHQALAAARTGRTDA
ncbi:hypothetical protein GCM10027055_01900 [Janibacter alkaliphilus]|uniref:DUF4446 family protein n=1 Tax=Janibacter alkaliphilus TaxID=1069963 RepID=A0A852X8Z5_9MICO|nr:hypothetical protein [Janibacter alkaliphilus]